MNVQQLENIMNEQRLKNIANREAHKTKYWIEREKFERLMGMPIPSYYVCDEADEDDVLICCNPDSKYQTQVGFNLTNCDLCREYLRKCRKEEYGDNF